MRPFHCAPRSRFAVTLSAALLALSAGACGSSKAPSATPAAGATQSVSAGGFAGVALPSEAPHDFTLSDEHRRAVSSRDYRGRAVLLVFAGTRCGAPCTVMADQIRGALDQLAGVPVLIVSIDPAGDSAAAVARFLARSSLTGRVRYLTGTPAQLRAAWSPYHVPAPARGSAVFERFAPVFLLDRNGRPRVEYALEQLTPEALVHDIRALGH
jgi:protein SCO1/2